VSILPWAGFEDRSAHGEKPPANQAMDPNNKKLHFPLGWWSFYVIRLEQLWAIAISQWLKKIFTPVRLLSFAKGYEAFYAQFISQRSGWIVFQIRATCTIGAMGAKV